MSGDGREKLVVIGNGMVGQRFCEKLQEHGGGARFEVTVLGEEPRPAYDRVHLSEFFSGRTADDLALVEAAWFAEQGVALELNACVDTIDRDACTVTTTDGRSFAYDQLVLATGSAPFVPPIPGTDLPGVFVYRTIEDLEAIRDHGAKSKRAAVIGGGLLGLEAAKALVEMNLATTVVEFADRLMPRQVDDAGGDLLRRSIEALGVDIMLGARTQCVLGEDGVSGLRFDGDDDLDVDMVVISAGIRPRDELARACGLEVGERGGIVVDEALATSDPHVHALGECALRGGMIYGLVAPGYDMADVLARRLLGEDRSFEGADMSTKLKLLGVDVGSFGDAFAAEGEGAERIERVVYEDAVRGVYQKVLVDREAGRLVGGVLVGDTEAYATLADATRREHQVVVVHPGQPRAVGGLGDGLGEAVVHRLVHAEVAALELGPIRHGVEQGPQRAVREAVVVADHLVLGEHDGLHQVALFVAELLAGFEVDGGPTQPCAAALGEDRLQRRDEAARRARSLETLRPATEGVGEPVARDDDGLVAAHQAQR